VTQRDLAITLHDGVPTRHIVEGVSFATAELGDDASRWDELIAGDAPSVPQHDIVKDLVVLQETLVGNSPAKPDGRERSPTVAWGQSGRPVPPEGEARHVFVGEVVVGLPEKGQQRILATRREDVLAGSQCILDVSGIDARVHESTD